MSQLNTTIQTAISALSDLRPDTLTSDQLTSSILRLESLDVNEAIDVYWRDLPVKPENEQEIPEWEELMHKNAKDINQELHIFNDELSRIKSLHNTLHVAALEPLIRAAQEIIRPLYTFTAQLNS